MVLIYDTLTVQKAKHKEGKNMTTINNYRAVINTHTDKLPILFKSVLVGLVAGVVVAAYRLILTYAGEGSIEFYKMLNGHLQFIPLVFIFLGLLGYGVGILVSKYEMIRGSGIPQVSGVILGYFKHNWVSTLIAKFIGGIVSISAGLSLGREGPSIQIGACVAEGVGNIFGSSRTEKRILIASGASAGLAAAFNAPLAGAMFAVEEIFKYFSPIILLSTMASAITADFVSKIVFGMSPIFNFTLEGVIQLNQYWLLFLLGGILGAAGAFYNYILLFTQKLYKKIPVLNVKSRLVVPFLCAGLIGLYYPLALGSGHQIIEVLQSTSSLQFLLILLVVKFVFSMISFGSGAPGGIFFPLLILGAIIGAIFGNITINFLGGDPVLFSNWVVLAMAGYFTAIVRAPITGIILLIEMTGSLNHLLPLAIVSIVAYILADLLNSKPIYESMLDKLIKERKLHVDSKDNSRKITVENIVQHGSEAENKEVRQLAIPKSSLLIAVRRHGHDIIPHGYTKIRVQDYLVLLTSISNEVEAREGLDKITKTK